jgi:hypothetical protein
MIYLKQENLPSFQKKKYIYIPMLNHFNLHLFVSTSYIMACFDDYPSQKLKNNQSFINVDLSYPYTNSCFGMLWNYTA